MLFDVLEACLAARPRGELDGLSRIELDVITTGLPGAVAVERVDATSGRKTYCRDGVDEPTPVDASEVARHDELAECIAEIRRLRRSSWSPFRGVAAHAFGRGDPGRVGSRRRRPPGEVLGHASRALRGGRSP